jgi:hypothetical protein
MKHGTLFKIAILCAAAFAIKNVQAGSAIALAPNDKMVLVVGVPVEIAKERALAEARRKYGQNARLLGYSDVIGYCAIAVARHPNGHGSIICASLGKRSAAEADTLAIEHCLKLGGTRPKIIRAIRG